MAWAGLVTSLYSVGVGQAHSRQVPVGGDVVSLNGLARLWVLINVSTVGQCKKEMGSRGRTS